MDKLKTSDGGLTSFAAESDEESFLGCSDAPSIDFISLKGLNPSSRDVTLDQYDSDDGTSLDAVLANVHRLMDSLKVVEIDESSLTSDNLVAKATAQMKTPESVDELIFELCGATTSHRDNDEDKTSLPEATSKPAARSCDEKDLRGANDVNNKAVIESPLVESPNEDHNLSMTSEVAEISNAYVNKKTNIKLTSLNKQEPISNFEYAQVSNKALPNPETSTFVSTKKVNGENEALLVIANHDKSTLSASNDGENLADMKSNRKKIFKKAKSENSNYFNSRIVKENCTEDVDFPKQPVTEADFRTKEKKKLTSSLSFAEKSTGNLKLFLPIKRKTSSNKEPTDMRKISAGEAKCTCFNLQDDKSQQSNTGFAMQDLKGVPDEKQGNKTDKAARKKNFWNREKKLSLSFRRSPSSEGKNALGLNDNNLKVNPNHTVLVTLDQSNLLIDPLDRPVVLKRRTKPNLFGQKSVSMCLDDEKSLEVLARKRTSASPRLMSKLSSHFSIFSQNEADSEVTRVDSKPKLPHKILSEFETEEDVKRRRATMDSTPIRPKFLESFVHRKNGLEDDDPNSPTYSSLPRKLHHSTRQPTNTLSVAQFAPSHGSNGSLKGSKDSLEDEDFKSNLGVRQGRMKGLVNMDEHQLEFLRSRMASSKTKKNILRKSMRYVGKATSVPAPDGDETMAGRTWLPEGDCSWMNLNGDKVGIESTRLQSLSELESDALRKVSLARLHEADLGVSIVVPKDESKVLDRKVSLKKRYGVHLTKEKNKDKGFDHVFGIPLVNVVENDQLLRLQKSASFAPSLEYQQQSEQNESTGGGAQGSSLSSDIESSSGSTNSIHNHPGTQNQEEVSSPGVSDVFNKSSSSGIINNGEQTPKSPEIDNVFSGRDNTSQSQTPTSAKSTGVTAAQSLRRRGAIAADSINEIDPYQSQLLEALSLSVAGSTTHSQKKVKKRSLLPPTMVQVPYVVQKCCDHLQKYGLNQAGIFRVPGSKKRVKQLREQFDRGIDVTIDETYNPHDVAALLKEFFRDLPEALLTRELYPAFLQTTKLDKHQDRLDCLRYLVWLLPLTHRDTLHTLLKFLALVAAHSEDTLDTSGNKLFGNKMTVMNLATIFGPNILHRYKKSTPSNGDSHHYQVQSVEKPEENSAVIKVMEGVISNQVLLFQIPKEEHNQMLRILKESDPEAVDFLLRRKAAHHMRHKPRLLGGHSSSFNSSKNFPNHNHVLPSFEDESPETQSPSDSDADFPDRVRSPADLESGEAGHSAVMRLSYQQATGHAMLPSTYEEKQDKPGVLKFKRPFFMKSKSHPSPNSERPATPDHMSTFSDINEITDEMEELKNDQDCLTVSPIAEDNISNGSAWSTQSHQLRSMSFTDDDLEAILGGKSPSTSRSELSKTDDFKIQDPVNNGYNDCCGLNQIDDLEIYEDESRSVEKTIPEEDAFVDDSSNIIRAAHSSDSGVYVDFSRKLTNSSSDPVKRRGGFSLEISPNEDSEKDEDSYIKFESQEEHFFQKADEDQSLTDHVHSQSDLEKRKDSVLENSCESSGENDEVKTDVTNSLNKSVECLYGQNSDNSEPERSGNIFSEPTQSMEETNSALQKSSNEFTYLNLDTESATESVLNSGSESDLQKNLENRVSKKSSTSSFEQVPPSVTPRKNSPPSSSNFQPGPRPRVQRQYDSSSYNQMNSNTAAEKITVNNVVLNNDNAAVSSPKSEKESKSKEQDSTKLGVFRSEKANLVIKSSPSHRASSRGVNVAILAGKYSKDDKALVGESKPAPGSKWTSSGLIGSKEASKINMTSKRSSERSRSDKKKITPLNNNLEMPPWHAAVKDRTHLPETLV